MKYMSRILIYSDFDPTKVELSALAREAEEGSAYCHQFIMRPVEEEHLPPDVATFFNMGDE